MVNEDAFNGAVFAFAGAFGLVSAIAQQEGFDKALEVDRAVYSQLGAASGQMIKQQAGIEDPVDAQTAFGLLRGVMDTLGMDCVVLEEGPTRVSFSTGLCPVYMAGKNVGWSHEMLFSSCRAGSMGMLDAAVKQLNPKLAWRIARYRDNAEASCVEEIVLED